MTAKTNFSFELQFSAASTTGEAQRHALMGSLQELLQAAFAADDSAATVTVSDSHKGSNNKLVELVTTLQDARIATILQAFSAHNGVSVNTLE